MDSGKEEKGEDEVELLGKDEEKSKNKDEEDESDDSYVPKRVSGVLGMTGSRVQALKKVVMDRVDYFKARKEAREESESVIGKVIDFIDIPFNFIRRYTILPCDEEEYNHHYAIWWPFFGILFLLF